MNEFLDTLTPTYQTLFGGWLATIIQFGIKVLMALAVFFIGKFLIRLVKRAVARALSQKSLDTTVTNFIQSVVSIALMLVLIVVVIGVLGIEVVAFTAILASIGVGVGMALSKQLQNFAAGIIMIFTRPIRVGDTIEAQGVSGTVDAIEIFHTLLRTFDGKRVYIPNGPLCDGVIINYSELDLRRVEWTFAVEYSSDFDSVRTLLDELISKDSRVLPDPAKEIELHMLADSSVKILVRAWCNRADYWALYWDFNRLVYREFNLRHISFPFPTVTIKGEGRNR